MTIEYMTKKFAALKSNKEAKQHWKMNFEINYSWHEYSCISWRYSTQLHIGTKYHLSVVMV